MKRYTINPGEFTDSQWTELYYASEILPRKFESREDAKPVRRDRESIESAIEACLGKAEREAGDDSMDVNGDEWAEDLRGAADELRKVLGNMSRGDARARLRDLLYSDIYTDAPEYASRVEEIHNLIPLALDVTKKEKQTT